MKLGMNKSFYAIFLVLVMALAFSTGALAHEDPPGCFATGATISLGVFRSDGTTPIPGGGTVQPGELIHYGATLSWAGGDNCYFGNGTTDTVHITTPDSVTHVVTPPGDVPYVSDGNPYVAPLQQYVVSMDDVNSTIFAIANYINGTAHTGTLHDTVEASATRQLAVEEVSLNVSKTAEPLAETGFEWDIDKSVSPSVWNLFDGDSGSSDYIINLTKTEGSANYSVSGNITIHNPASFANATIESVTDEISGVGSVSVDCNVAFPYTLGPNETLTCTYESALPNNETRTNTVNVTTSGDVLGGSANATIDFADAELITSNDEVTVDDSVEGLLGTFNDSSVVSYSATFLCDEDEGIHDNTATILETNQSSSASVTVNCYELTVEKTANTTFDREWNWSIEKMGDTEYLQLLVGENATVNYEVSVNASSTDSNYAVYGTINITNTHPTLDADLVDVTDEIFGSVDAVVDCGNETSVPANSSLLCTYEASLDSLMEGDNVASVTQQNYDYDAEGNASLGGTTDYSGLAPVVFGEPVNEIDSCVEVNDTLAGSLGTVCANETPSTFSYEYVIGPFDEEQCGEIMVNNTASFMTSDTNTTGEAHWSVLVEVECPLGCTLTPGYWMTHSAYGPAPYDDTWSLIEPDEEDTTFFLSGQSYYEVLHTAPRGNAYYQLAFHYIAAELNFLNEAGAPTDVQDAFDDATTLFETYTPSEVGGWRGNQGQRSTFIELAGILDDYNNGVIGPGHCDAME